MSERSENALIPISGLAFPFIHNAVLDLDGERIQYLLAKTLARINDDYMPVSTLKSIVLSDHTDEFEGCCGLTHCSFSESESRTEEIIVNHQSIILYMDLLQHLSHSAVIAVIAHELAHAWLNEHQFPDQSVNSETEADKLAAEWGFEEELKLLEEERD